MFNRPLTSFVPTFYKDIVEIDDIIAAEQAEIDLASREMSTAFANTFVLTSDESGVIMFESMLGIIADTQTEDLEFRRQRVMNRLSTSPPFTYRFLKHKLDEIIGAGAWKAYIDFNNYTLYVESSASDQNWYYEAEVTINRVKPCNIVFINVPYTARDIGVSEEISYSQVTWMYRLGSWRLGKYPFATLQEGGVIKMPQVRSIQQALLNDTANFIAEDVSSVLLNDTVVVSDFTLKQVSGNIVSIEYAVTPEMTNLITNIKLRRANDTVLTEATVYVPVTQTVLNKHIITVKEGV